MAPLRAASAFYPPTVTPFPFSTTTMRNVTVLAALALLLPGCGSDRVTDTRRADGDPPAPGGTLVIAASGDPDILLPPLIASAVADMVTDQLFDPLASLGADLNTVGDRGFQPRLAKRWTWSADSLSIAFHLDPDARWHDGAPVRARDVVFTHATYTDPKTGSPVATNLSSIDSVTARDSLTPVFWFRRRTPEQFQDAAYTMSILPEHLLGNANRADLRSSVFGRQPVGTGRFRFVKWEPGVRLELVADTLNYRGRARLDRVILSFAPDFNSAVAKLFSGEADFFETLRPEQLEEMKKHPELRTIPYQAMDYMYLQFNLRTKNGRQPHPVLGDRETRRALSMALDRRRMVQNVFDSLAVVAVGPGPRGQASTDTTVAQLPYDTARARRALDSLGWRDANGDGVRERNGRPLRFSVLVPSSSRTRVRLAVLMQEQLRALGVKLDIEELEFSTFLDRMGRRDFEAIMGAAHTDPSPIGLRQAWSSAAAAKGGSNFGWYESAAFDAQVDSALASMDPAAARAHFKAAFQVIIDDAPAVWLYEPRPIAGAHRRIRATELRPDGWWSGLADWWIPPGERLPRDRIGLRAATVATETSVRASDTSAER